MTGDLELSEADITFAGAGWAVDFIPDASGDGLDQFLLSSPRANSGHASGDEGAAYLFVGGGISGVLDVAEADWPRVLK